MRELKKGEKVDGFIVKSLIGSGGMGQVYLVCDQRLAVDRAMKVISLTGDGFTGGAAEVTEYQQRFIREARTLARLRHQNVVPVHTFGEFEGNPYLVMTHFPGKDARRWLNEEKPTLDRVRAVGIQMGKALEHAHGQGVLHRDLKLSNILVGPNDEAMLIDFGLAKSKFDTNLTRTGKAMGTYSYLAPEYVKASTAGKPQHTVLTDLWAFGCILYALTCRRPAFQEKDELRLLGLIQVAQFDPVKKLSPDVPDAWADAIHALMEPDPARRLQTATAAVAALQKTPHLAGAVRAILPAPPPPPEDAGEESVDVSDELQAASIETVAGPGREGEKKAAANAKVQAEASSTLFSHPSRAAPVAVAVEATPVLPEPSFQRPSEAVTSAAKTDAKRKLLLPLVAAGLVLLLGGGAITVAGSSKKAKQTHEFVDPDEVARDQRASQEVRDIDEQRARLRKDATAPSPAQPMTTVPMFAEPAAPAPARDDGVHHADTQPHKTSPTLLVAALPPNPWTERYGTRTSFNTSSSLGSTTSAAATTAAKPASAPAAGVRIPVHVRDAIASAPVGPVIATVDAPTQVGAVEIPRGAEIHGTVSGASGPRVLVQFAFAIADGKSVPLKCIAFGADGRAGVPGKKNLGDGSGLAAAAAGAGTSAALEAAAALTQNDILGAAVRGAAPSAASKAGRLDNDEELVVAPANTRFFVYVESDR